MFREDDCSRPSGHPVKAWLARVIAGGNSTASALPQANAEEVLAVAVREGVVGPLGLALQRIPATGLPPGLPELVGDQTRSRAVQSLRMNSECIRILEALDGSGLQVLLLKGSALAHWAYPSAHLRECSDIDLLLASRTDAETAATILGSLNYVRRDHSSPGDLISFEITCTSSESRNAGLEVDLHWQLSSVPMFAFQLDFATLWDQSIALPRLSATARGLGGLHAYLHACMHRVQNMEWDGQDGLKWLYDLHVLGQGFDLASWQRLAAMAVDRGLAGVCLDGINASARWFGPTAPTIVQQQLALAEPREPMKLARMHGWFYIQWMNFCAYPSRRERLRWLRQRLLPDVVYLRDRYQGRGSLTAMLLARARDGVKKLFS